MTAEMYLWTLLGLSILGTLVWRLSGAAVARHINPTGAFFQWASCVAYGMLAALISRVLILPVGMLADTPTLDRLIAMAAGFALFFAARRDVFIGTMGAFLTFLGLASLRASGMI